MIAPNTTEETLSQRLSTFLGEVPFSSLEGGLFAPHSRSRFFWHIDAGSGALFGVLFAREDEEAARAVWASPGFAWRECVFEGERLRVVQAECEAKEGEDRATWYRADATSFEALPDGSDVLRVLNLRYPEAASQKEAQQYVAAISALALQLRGGASLPEAASTQKTWTLDARGAATTLTFEGKRWVVKEGGTAATKDPTADFGWVSRQVARFLVAEEAMVLKCWREEEGYKEAWMARRPLAFASAILAASLFLRTKGRYAQWVDVSDNTLTMESLLAEAMLKKGVKKEEKEEEKSALSEENDS